MEDDFAYLDSKAASISAAAYGSDYDAEPAIKALLREAFSRGQRAAVQQVKQAATMLQPWGTPIIPGTFEQAWARFKAAGYQYGHDALEQVRFGWDIAHGKVPGG